MYLYIYVPVCKYNRIIKYKCINNCPMEYLPAPDDLAVFISTSSMLITISTSSTFVSIVVRMKIKL